MDGRRQPLADRVQAGNRAGAPGLYVHLPFCEHRCPYCGFAAVVGQDHLQERYAAAVAAEISRRRAGAGPFRTVFFGGGTPSRTRPALIARLLEAADRVCGIAAGAEITIEANPASADRAAFGALRRAGCTRLSLGVQSLADATLGILGRGHSAADAERAFAAARATGFDQVSVDLIFSVPGAPPGDWSRTLGRTVALGPDHVSAYALTIEAGTPFHRRQLAGELEAVGEDEDAAAFLAAGQILRGAGYEHYEVSNFARPGCRCRHNWSCWMGEEYVGVGLAAHSYLGGRRAWNTTDLNTHLERVEAGAPAEEGAEILPAGDRARELAWLRLRTAAGLRLGGAGRARLQADGRAADLVRAGLAALDDRGIRLTPRGLAVADGAADLICDGLGVGSATGRPEGWLAAVA